MTRSVVRDTTTPPFSKPRCADFLHTWPALILWSFRHHLDAGTHRGALWSTNIPSSLKELLWKEITSLLPLGPTWYGDLALGHACWCGMAQSLTHIWGSCHIYNLAPCKT